MTCAGGCWTDMRDGGAGGATRLEVGADEADGAAGAAVATKLRMNDSFLAI